MPSLPITIALIGVVSLLLLGWIKVLSPVVEVSAFDSKQATQIGISCVVLLASLYVILFMPNAEDSQKNWAFGAVGTLLGFWLKH